MVKVSVHAFEDPGRPEGGHAVLLLQGLTRAPDVISFRLKPGDAAISADAAGWPSGELKPLASRMTGDGLELQVGPDVTESELLLPGTLVEIELPGADARGAFVWPNIAPMLRPRRRTVIVNTPKRKSQAASAEIAAAKVGAEAAADTPQPETVRGSVAGPQVAAAADALDAATPADTSHGEPPVAPAANDAAVSPPARVLAAALAEAAAVADKVSAAKAVEPALPAATSLRGAPIVESRAEVTAGAGAGAAPKPSRSAAPQATLRGAPPAADVETRSAGAATRPARSQQSDGYYPHARGGGVAPATRAQSSRRSGALLQAGIGILAVGAAFYVLSRESARRVAPQPAADPTTTVALAPPPAAVPLPARPQTANASMTPITPSGEAAASAAAPTALYESLSVGALSPRGASAAGVGPSKALENANAHLAGAGRDADEAGFWLKRYIAQTLGNDRTTRALTQLGSVYAEPSSGAADYVKARLVWEIASAAGDPVAMCFLGLLFENGLGTAADKRAALAWYERSKQVGGCPSVDDAIARVRQ